MPRQLITDNFAVVLVIFDDKDADGIRFALLRAAHQAGGGPTIPALNHRLPGSFDLRRSYLPMIRTRTHSVLTAQASAVTIR